MAAMIFVAFCLMLLAPVLCVPDILPGSEETNNFAGLCENTYQYPSTFEIGECACFAGPFFLFRSRFFCADKCGRCELPQNKNRTCDCPVDAEDCLRCPGERCSFRFSSFLFLFSCP